MHPELLGIRLRACAPSRSPLLCPVASPPLVGCGNTKYSPQFPQQAHAKKKPVGASWRLDETYIKIKGQWTYLYRAVDKEGNTVDFLLTATRDTKAALQVSAQSDWLEWTTGEDLYR